MHAATFVAYLLLLRRQPHRGRAPARVDGLAIAGPRLLLPLLCGVGGVAVRAGAHPQPVHDLVFLVGEAADGDLALPIVQVRHQRDQQRAYRLNTVQKKIQMNTVSTVSANIKQKIMICVANLYGASVVGGAHIHLTGG